MIRTKDLLLFVLSLLFLLMAIFFTLSEDSTSSNSASEVTFSSQTYDVSGGTYTETKVDRPSIISRLRQAIANTEVISSPTIVETNVELVDSEVTSEVPVNQVVTLLRCESMKDPLTFAKLWPREGVVVDIVEGVRSVSFVESLPASAFDQVSPSTTTLVNTQPVITATALAQLPLNPIVGDKKCLTSEIVGVTTGGSLLFNSDAIAYYNRPTEQLIGYARDGLPIYGNYIGSTDECGGYEVNGQYRYSVSSERNYILGCYKAAPQNFIGE